MAVDGGDIRITFTGDSSGLNSELKKIDQNLGEVSKATAGASNGMEKGLVKGAKAADKAADKMASLLDKMKTPKECYREAFYPYVTFCDFDFEIGSG